MHNILKIPQMQVIKNVFVFISGLLLKHFINKRNFGTERKDRPAHDYNNLNCFPNGRKTSTR